MSFPCIIVMDPPLPILGILGHACTCVYLMWNFIYIRVYMSPHIFSIPFSLETAVLAGRVPFCSPLLEGALLNPLLLFKLSAYNELK